MKMNNKFYKKMKGLSGIISAVILFAMLFSVGTGYFIFVNQNNRIYSQALANRADSIQSTISENLQITTILSNNNIAFYVNNTGSLSVNITSVFVYNSTRSILKYLSAYPPAQSNTNPPLPIVVAPGRGSKIISTGQSYVSGKTYIIQLNTQRGNTFTATYPPSATSLAAQALSSGAIGDLYLKHDSYTYYLICTTPNPPCTPWSSGTAYLQKQGPAFSIPYSTATNYPIAFSVKVTNLNPNQQNITLDKYTLINQVVVPQGSGSNFKSMSWFIVSISNSSGQVQILSTYSKITLLYNQPQILVFASQFPGTFSGYILSKSFLGGNDEVLVFILSHGCKGRSLASCTSSAANYGQNMPYVSTLYY